MKGKHLLRLNIKLASVNPLQNDMNSTYQHCPTSLVQISQQINPKSNPLNLNFQDLSNNTKGTSQFLLLELNGRHLNVTTSSTDFSIQNLVF